MTKKYPEAFGRVVRYMARGSADGVYKPEARIAIGLTHTDHTREGMVTLLVLTPVGQFWDTVLYSEDGKPGSWWMPLAPLPGTIAPATAEETQGLRDRVSDLEIELDAMKHRVAKLTDFLA